MPVGKRSFLINPLNNTNDGFSFKNGNPVVKFSVPSQDVLLETATLRLCGQLQVKDQAGVLVNPDGKGDGTTDGTSTMNNDANNANQSPQCAINLGNFGGVHNCIDKIVISSKKTKMELVNESHYSQYTALRQGTSANKEEFLRQNLTRSQASGNNADLVNRRMVSSVNTAVFTATEARQVGNFFSVKLNVPMLGLMPLHLGDEFLGGLDITIYLSPDSAVFCSRNRHIAAGNVATNDPTGASYVLKNLQLNGRYVLPDANDLKNYPKEMVYANRVNLINDVHSSVNSSGYTPQVQFNTGIDSVFQRGDVINNFTLNQNNFSKVLGLRRVVQSKNGLRFPYDFPVDVVPNFNTITPAGASLNPADLHFKSLGMGDAEVRLHHNRALTGRSRLPHTSADLKATEEDVKSQYETAGINDSGFNLTCDMSGIGADYSFGMGMTQNYINQDYALEITSGVNTGNARLPSDTRNQTLLQNTFIKNFETLDLKSLVKVM